MLTILLLVLIWAMVLVPPAIRFHAARQEAFLVSLGPRPMPDPGPPRPHSRPTQRRRRIAGGLLVAMAVTLVVGLLPTFRVLLVVHLFLVDSFLGYIALLAHMANRAARRPTTQPAFSEEPQPAEAEPRRRRAPLRRRGMLPELSPLASAG